MKRKRLIKSIVFLILLLCVFGIYQIFKTDQINYIALGDSLAEGMNPYGEVEYSYTDYVADGLKAKKQLASYTKKYTKSGYTTEDVITQINNNLNLKKDLRESDLVTVSIGANDFLRQIHIKTLNINDLLTLKTKVMNIFPNIKKC